MDKAPFQNRPRIGISSCPGQPDRQVSREGELEQTNEKAAIFKKRPGKAEKNIQKKGINIDSLGNQPIVI